MSPNDSEYRSPADAELIRYLDSELPDADRTRLESSLAQDSALRERLDTLRRRGRKLRTMLEASDPPAQRALNAGVVPLATHHARRPARLLAAAVVLLVIGAVAVPPVRAWVVQQWQRLSDGGSQTQEPPAPDAAAPAAVPARFDLHFDVAHPTFDVHVLNYQRSGTLLVRVENVAKGSASIPQAKGEEVYTLPGGLRIVNGATSLADYEVVIPLTVRKVTVRLPNAPFIVYSTLDTANHRRVIELTRR